MLINQPEIMKYLCRFNESVFFAKVYRNVYNYQLTEYAKSQGSTLSGLSGVERKTMEEGMMRNKYPGEEITRPRLRRSQAYPKVSTLLKRS